MRADGRASATRRDLRLCVRRPRFLPRRLPRRARCARERAPTAPAPATRARPATACDAPLLPRPLRADHPRCNGTCASDPAPGPRSSFRTFACAAGPCHTECPAGAQCRPLPSRHRGHQNRHRCMRRRRTGDLPRRLRPPPCNAPARPTAAEFLGRSARGTFPARRRARPRVPSCGPTSVDGARIFRRRARLRARLS